MAVIYSIIMFKRCHEMSRVQTYCWQREMLVMIDWDVKVNDIRSNKPTKRAHAVATSIVFDCVTSSYLPDNGQQKNLATCDLNELTSVEHEETREL